MEFRGAAGHKAECVVTSGEALMLPPYINLYICTVTTIHSCEKGHGSRDSRFLVVYVHTTKRNGEPRLLQLAKSFREPEKKSIHHISVARINWKRSNAMNSTKLKSHKSSTLQESFLSIFR